MASSISITKHSGLDLLTTTVNPISMYVKQDDTPYTYLLFTLPGTETTGAATISITNNTGYIYGAIIGPPGNAGLSSGNNGGGGGGGSGAFCNFPFYQSNSTINYTVFLNSSNSSENSIVTTHSNSFEIRVDAGDNGADATDNSGGDGGKGAVINASNMTFGSVSMSDCQFSGGGGGGGGDVPTTGDPFNSAFGSSGNGGSATTDGTTVKSYTIPGENGGTGDDSNSSGTSGGGFGGSTSNIFSDGTSILVSAGEGADSTSDKRSNATSGSLSWVMIYYRTNQVTFSNSSSSSSTIQPLIDITVTEYKKNGSTSTPTVNTISTTNFNPFTYYNNTTTPYTYTLVDCLPTDTSNNENYYTCSFTVPNDGNTYYWAGIGAGGLPGSNSYDSNNNASDDDDVSGGGGGGGGAGAFLNFQLQNNCTYEFKMYSLNYNNKLTITTSSNEIYTYTIPTGVIGYDGTLMEVAGVAYIGDGGAGGAGGSWSTNDLNNITNFEANGGGGGGGGGAFQQYVNNVNNTSYYVKSGIGGTGGDKYVSNGVSYGVNGTDGEPGATTNNSNGYIDEGGVGGNTKYTFFDGSSVFVSAGHGTYGTYKSVSNNATRINATSGPVTWMMIYGPTQNKFFF